MIIRKDVIVTLKIAIKRETCKLAYTWPSVSDLSKASPLNSRVVHSTPGYDKCIASTLKESPNYAVGALFQSACLRRNLSVGPSDTTAIER